MMKQITILWTKPLPVWEEAGSAVLQESGQGHPGVPVTGEVTDLAVR